MGWCPRCRGHNPLCFYCLGFSDSDDEPEPVQKARRPMKYTVTLVNQLGAQISSGEHNGDSMEIEAGHLLIMRDGELVHAYAPGHWSNVTSTRTTRRGKDE